MANLKHVEIRVIEEGFQGDPGYVLDFSDRTFREFFEDEVHVDIDHDRYRNAGGSKMNRLRTFLRIEPPNKVAATLRALWAHTNTSNQFYRPHLPGWLYSILRSSR